MKNSFELLLVLPVLLPVFGAVLCCCLGKAGEKKDCRALIKARDILLWLVPGLVLADVIVLAFSGEVFSACRTVTLSCTGLCGLGVNLRFSGMRWLLCLVGSAPWFACALFGTEYLKGDRHINRYGFYYLLTEGATLGVFLSADFYTTLIFFEVMSIASWVLVIHDDAPSVSGAADSYLAFAVLGGLVTLMGLFLLYRMFGTLDIEALGDAVSAGGGAGTALYTAGLLTLFGFAAKAGMWPLHTWMPASYTAAPAPVSALLSSVISKAGVFGVAALSGQIFFGDRLWGNIILILSLVTMVTGAVLGLFSTNLKRTLACSSMSQIGFILTGVGMSCLLGHENAGAAQGMALHLLNHTIFKLTLFIAAGAVVMKLHELDLNKIRGFGRGKPVLIFAMLMGLWGLAGIPGGSGYISKTILHESIAEYIGLLEESGLAAGVYHAAEWVFLISGGCTLAYMLKLFVCLCMERNSDPGLQKEYDSMNGRWCSRITAVILVLCAALVPALGLTPHLTMDRLAGLAGPFFRAGEAEGVSYFVWGNLKGSLISITAGLIIYFLVVRLCLVKSGRYINAWPSFLDLEKKVYRPVVLGALPFLGALAARVIASLPEWLRKLFCLVLFARRGEGFVHPREDGLFTVYEQQPAGSRGFTASLAYSLLMFCLGIVVVLIYLFVH